MINPVLLGSGLYPDKSIAFKIQKFTVCEKYRNLVLPLNYK